jgi:hypothetical protein
MLDAMHTALAEAGVDRRDVRRLCRHFDVPLPEDFSR